LEKTAVPDLKATEELLYDRVSQIIDTARGHVARAVNTTMVQAYWLIGFEIVEYEQGGQKRSEYGTQLLKRLSKHLSQQFGAGFGASNLSRMRQFYLTFPQGSALAQVAHPRNLAALRQDFHSTETIAFPPNLSWTHYRILLAVHDPTARSFYEIEAAQENWGTRALERQIGSKLFERLAMSRDKERILELGRQGQELSTAEDVVKDPFVLEFLGLHERSGWLERDLEQAIMDRLQDFLLELGKGFCFVARQQRLTLEGDHFYVDLVFYNRLLRCFVLIDLKMNKVTHQDLGQMQMYVNYYDRYQKTDEEAATIGIILGSKTNEAMVRITLPKDNTQIHASRYSLYLPTELELQKAVMSERRRMEQALRLPERVQGAEE